MKILITGSSGFIGFHLSKKLLDNGLHVTGIDNLNDYYDIYLKQKRQHILEEYKNYKNYNHDINDIKSVINDSFDIAVNLAAQAGVRLPESENYKYINSNLNGFKSFLSFCESKKIKKIIYASSSSVYSGNKTERHKETDFLETPKSFYADTKIKNEIDASLHSNNFGSKIIGLRFFTVYGPFGRPDMAYFNFTKQIVSNEKVSIFNDGNTYRDMTYIDDVSTFIENIIQNMNNLNGHEIFNVGNENPIHTLKLIRSIEAEFGIKANLEKLTKKNEVHKTHANCTKASKFLDYNPKIKFDEGINKFFHWYREFYKL